MKKIIKFIVNLFGIITSNLLKKIYNSSYDLMLSSKRNLLHFYGKKKELKKNINHNKKLCIKLNLNINIIKNLLKERLLEIDENFISWHWYIFAGLATKEKLNILEIGTYKGLFTKFLSKNFPNSNITTVDLPDDNYQFANTYGRNHPVKRKKFFEERRRNLNQQNINFIQVDSFYLKDNFADEYFDLIWIDGDHHNPQVTIDIYQSIKLAKKNAIICVDDIIKKDSLHSSYKYPEIHTNESYKTLEALERKKILKNYYFVKRLIRFGAKGNFANKSYISFSKKYVSSSTVQDGKG